MPGNRASPRSFLMSVKELCSNWVDPLSWRSSLTCSPSWIEVGERKKKVRSTDQVPWWQPSLGTCHQPQLLVSTYNFMLRGHRWWKRKLAPMGKMLFWYAPVIKAKVSPSRMCSSCPWKWDEPAERKRQTGDKRRCLDRALLLAMNLYCKVQNTFCNLLIHSSSQIYVALSRTHPNRTKEAKNILIQMLSVSHSPCMSKDLCVLLISFMVNWMLF